MAYFKGAFFVVEHRSVVRRSGGVSKILKAFMFVVFIVIVASLSTSVTVFGKGDASRVRLRVE